MLDFPRWKVLSILGFLAALMLLAVPSFLPESVTDKWGSFPHSRINLGLDLAGGSYLLLEADTKDVAATRLESMRERVVTELRRGTPKIETGDVSVRDGKLSFLLRDVSQVDHWRRRRADRPARMGHPGGGQFAIRPDSE
jgi:preprotein translocase subunit SecD